MKIAAALPTVDRVFLASFDDCEPDRPPVVVVHSGIHREGDRAGFGAEIRIQVGQPPNRWLITTRGDQLEIAFSGIADRESALFEHFHTTGRLRRFGGRTGLRATGQEKGKKEEHSHPASASASGGGVDADVAQLAVKRGAANAEPARYLGHAAAVVADG